MKKTLLALAIAGAWVGAAQAQSTVTLYGLIDTYVEATSLNGKSTNPKLSAGGLNGPRWGMTGSEDLGGGLKAIFTLEGGFNSDNGTLGQGGRIFGRQGFVGLEGGFGSLKLGRQYAPVFYTQADSDIDGYTTFSIPGNSFGLDANMLRQDNQIRYTTPKLGGVAALMFSYAPGEVAGNSTTGRLLGANISAGFGPATLVAGYHKNNVNSATVDSNTEYAIGGNMKFGAFGVAANYTNFKLDNKTAADVTTKQWSLGANYTAGSFIMLGQYGETKNDLNHGKEKSWLLGADYNLSKRTTIYGRWAQTTDDGKAAGTGATPIGWYALGDINTNEKGRTLALGLRHRF